MSRNISSRCEVAKETKHTAIRGCIQMLGFAMAHPMAYPMAYPEFTIFRQNDRNKKEKKRKEKTNNKEKYGY